MLTLQEAAAVGVGTILAVRNYCYVAVCSAARGASAPKEGEEGWGHIVVAARLQLVDSRKDIDQKNVFICLHALAYIHTNIQTDRQKDRQTLAQHPRSIPSVWIKITAAW